MKQTFVLAHATARSRAVEAVRASENRKGFGTAQQAPTKEKFMDDRIMRTQQSNTIGRSPGEGPVTRVGEIVEEISRLSDTISTLRAGVSDLLSRIAPVSAPECQENAKDAPGRPRRMSTVAESLAGFGDELIDIHDAIVRGTHRLEI